MRLTPDWRFASNASPGTGKTKSICEAAKAIGGVVVTTQRDRLKEVYGVETCSFESPRNLLGQRKPILFDTDAVAAICAYYETELGMLRLQIEKLKSTEKP